MWTLTTLLVKTQNEVKSIVEKIYCLNACINHYHQIIDRNMDIKETAGMGSEEN